MGVICGWIHHCHVVLYLFGPTFWGLCVNFVLSLFFSCSGGTTLSIALWRFPILMNLRKNVSVWLCSTWRGQPRRESCPLWTSTTRWGMNIKLTLVFPLFKCSSLPLNADQTVFLETLETPPYFLHWPFLLLAISLSYLKRWELRSRTATFWHASGSATVSSASFSSSVSVGPRYMTSNSNTSSAWNPWRSHSTQRLSKSGTSPAASLS